MCASSLNFTDVLIANFTNIYINAIIMPPHCTFSYYVLAPLHCAGVRDMYETVACIFEKEPTPSVVATVNMTQDAHGWMLRPGTVLFPSISKKTGKKGEMTNAEFTTTLGTKVHLPMDCAAGFSTQVKDVKLYLPELVAHLTLPVEVKCFAQEHSRHCNKMSNITLTKVCTEASITGGLTVEGSRVKDQQLDLPLDLPVRVSCIELAKRELQQSLFAKVKSTYELVDDRCSTNWKVTIRGDTHAEAQQEFYSAVRTDITQNVVTVDVPERIYDEVGFGGVKIASTGPERVQRSSSVGARAVPKHPLPPLPPPSFERSKDEPYVQFMRRADVTQADVKAINIPTSSPPLMRRNFDNITAPGSIDIYDDPVLPLYCTSLPTYSDPSSKIPFGGLGDRTAACSVPPPPPPLPAKNTKQRKHSLPLLLSKPRTSTGCRALQPVFSSQPQTLPQRQEAIYEPLRPDTFNTHIYASLVHDNPTEVPPDLPPKRIQFKRAHTQPQLQVQAEGSNPIQVDEAGNIQYLKTLSCNDIIRLLEAMELPQYIDSFMKVSGTVEHTAHVWIACVS